MFPFLLKRLGSSLIVILIVAMIVFALTVASGGDPAIIFAGDDPSPERLEAIRERMGLDRPLPVQFLLWLRQIASGDFGTSLFTGRPVLTLIGQRVEPTIVLTL